MKDKVFIGSSREALPVAREVQKHFKERYEERYEVRLWNENVYRPGVNFLDSLLRIASHFNFGIFVFAADEARDTTERAVRGNVLFECGMFFGRVGRRRSFFLVPRDVENLHWPTDLAGVAPAHYQADCGDIAEACTAIDEVMKEELHVGEQTCLSGEWEETWVVPGTGYWGGQNRAPAEVLHIGDQFLAVCHDARLPFSVKGTVKWPFITGTWASDAEGAYFGAFQLKTRGSGLEMNGLMVGFDSENNIPAGTWSWKSSGAVEGPEKLP